jgi:cell division protein ZapE
MPGIAESHAALVARGTLKDDRAQAGAVKRLARLQAELREQKVASKSSALGWLLARGPKQSPNGVYLWGGVGRGKTMLMDLFFETTPLSRKRRAHFHAFMADVHDRIHAAREAMKSGRSKNGDPIRPVADALADQAPLLCFDEFHVTDIADAMILSRLFERLFERGVVVVATSNVPPQELYRDGLNRALFLPFVRLLESRTDTIELKARTDYRLEKLGHVPVWHVPADAQARAAIDRVWRELAGEDGGAPMALPFRGRTIDVPLAFGGAARFDFADLCEKPYGAADFVELAQRFHTLVIERIPVMGDDSRNEAKRFIALIDTLYDNAVKLVGSAAAEPDRLYTGTFGAEAFEFRRTASRLIEMRSAEYLARAHGAAGAASLPAAGNRERD